MKKRKVIGIILIVAIIGGGAFFAINRNQIVEVNTAVVVEGDIAKYVEELGVVKSENQVSVYANATGRVTEVLVDVGDRVEKGELLIKLDSQSLDRQIRELEAQKSIVTAQYQEAIKAVDDKEIEKLELKVRDAEVEVQEAQRAVNNNEKLYEAGA